MKKMKMPVEEVSIKHAFFHFKDGYYRQYEYMNWLVLHNAMLTSNSVTSFKSMFAIMVFEVYIEKYNTVTLQAMAQVLARASWKVYREEKKEDTVYYYCEH
jgi:hypothetical protein